LTIFMNGKLEETLKEIFGHEQFRPHQREIIEIILAGKDILATLPTGYGKSLCYQIPALIGGGTTIVVSPLISLIRDQADGLVRRGVDARFFDSMQDPNELRRQIGQLSTESPPMIYVSPERLRSDIFLAELKKMPIRRLVIDEAHCISMWGHDFRPSYIKLPHVRRFLGNPPVAAFTATAPVSVRDDIIDTMGMKEAVQVHGDVNRPNIKFDRKNFHSKFDKSEYLFEELEKCKRGGEPVIVYCARRNTTEELSEEATRRGFPNVFYHAGIYDKDNRLDAQRKFLSGLVNVIFATKAFGMGIDKPDIRRVIHFDVTDSLEGYYQEAGRAGRDGNPARCTLLYQYHDVFLQKGFLLGSNPSLSFLEYIYNKLWARIGRYKQYSAQPTINFFPSSFLDTFEDADPILRNKASSALAALEEHGVIQLSGRQLTFLVTKKDLAKSGKPLVDESLLRKKYDCDQQRLKVMLYYATTKEDPRSVILRHFRHNTVVEDVQALNFEDFVHLNPEHVKIMMRALSAREYERRYFATLLAGRAESKDKISGRLNPFDPTEILIEIEHAAGTGVIRKVPIEGRTYLSLTPQGMDQLEQNRTPVRPCTSYDTLSQRMYNPLERTTLRMALRSWFNIASATCRDKTEWWAEIGEFMDESYKVLDKEVKGRKLVADYIRKPAKDVKLRDASDFLNYLFDNRIG
jgi:ATP-dependent DNA helicase RecQ